MVNFKYLFSSITVKNGLIFAMKHPRDMEILVFNYIHVRENEMA